MHKVKRGATTVYLDPKLARAAKVKAAITDMSVSDMVNEALARYLQRDAEDLEIIRKRRGQPTRPYEDFLAELKRDGLI
jgi:hypothetical protein